MATKKQITIGSAVIILLVTTIYIIISNAHFKILPEPPILLFGARDNSDYHFQLILYNDSLYLLNAQYQIINKANIDLRVNKWYKVDARLRKDEKGEVDIFLNDELIFSHKNEDFDANGVSGTTEMFFGGQVIDSSEPILKPVLANIYIAAGYYLGNAESNEEIIVNFSVDQGSMDFGERTQNKVKTSFCFENQNFNEMGWESWDVDMVAMSRNSPGGRFAVRIPSSVDYMQGVSSYALPHDNDVIFGFYFMIDKVNKLESAI